MGPGSMTEESKFDSADTLGRHYPNPTIVEALCEVHFIPGQGAGWRASRPGPLLHALGDEYPELQPVLETGIHFNLGPGAPPGVQQFIQPEANRVRLVSEDGHRMVQAAGTVFVFNVIGKYPGWEDMKSAFFAAWKRAMPVFGAETVGRVGIRFINRIPYSADNDVAGNWLRPSTHTPHALIASSKPVMMRLETGDTESCRTNITVADDPPSEDATFGAFIFDIDCIWQGPEALDPNNLEPTVESLHRVVKSIFKSAMSDKLQAHLEGSKT